jgi:hypothetical protein
MGNMISGVLICLIWCKKQGFFELRFLCRITTGHTNQQDYLHLSIV